MTTHEGANFIKKKVGYRDVMSISLEASIKSTQWWRWIFEIEIQYVTSFKTHTEMTNSILDFYVLTPHFFKYLKPIWKSIGIVGFHTLKIQKYEIYCSNIALGRFLFKLLIWKNPNPNYNVQKNSCKTPLQTDIWLSSTAFESLYHALLVICEV